MWTQVLGIFSTLTILVLCRDLGRGPGDIREWAPTFQGDNEAADACREYPIVKILVLCRDLGRGPGDIREWAPTFQGDNEAADACREYPIVKRSPLSCCIIPRIANGTAVAECEDVFAAQQGNANSLCDRQKCIFGKSNLLDDGDIVSTERYIDYLRRWRNARKHWADAVDHVINKCLFVGESGAGRCQPIDLIHCTINTLFNHCPDEEFNFNAQHCLDISHFMQYCPYDLGTHLSYLQNLADSIPDSSEEN